HGSRPLRKACDQVEDGRVTRSPKLAVVFPIASADMLEEGLLYGVEPKQRPTEIGRNGACDSALAARRHAVDEDGPLHCDTCLRAASAAPITPASSPRAAGSIGH